MCKFIGVEVLAANALIDILDAKKGTKVSFDILELYGIKVAKCLEEKNINAVILFNQNLIGNMIIDYSDCFEVAEDSISVKAGITVEELRQRFRAPLAYEILKAIVNKDVVKYLLNLLK